MVVFGNVDQLEVERKGPRDFANLVQIQAVDQFDEPRSDFAGAAAVLAANLGERSETGFQFKDLDTSLTPNDLAK